LNKDKKPIVSKFMYQHYNDKYKDKFTDSLRTSKFYSHLRDH